MEMRPTALPQRDTASDTPNRRPYVVPILLAVAVTLPYLPALRNGFVWLDHREIVEGSLLVRDLTHICRVFLDDNNYRGYHRPFYNLLHSLDAALWGLRPVGFHLSSLGLHLVNCALVYTVMRKTGAGECAAAIAAGLWGVHPVNSAAVGLIHAKADLFVVTLLLLAVLALLRVQKSQDGAPLHWFASVATFTVALFTKETAFLFPLAVAPWCWRWGRSDADRARSAVGYLAVVWLIAATVALVRLVSRPFGTYASPCGLGERLLTFGSVYLEYLTKLALPVHLSVCDTVTRFSALPWGMQTGVIVFCLVVGLLQVATAALSPRLRTWIVLYNLALIPVAQVVPILHFKAERFLYLPSLAFVGFWVEVAILFWHRVGQAGIRSRRRQTAVAAAVAGLYLISSTAIVSRVRQFENDATLFDGEVARTPDYEEGLSVLAHYHDAKGAFDRAESYYRQCLKPHPDRLSYLDVNGVIVDFSYNLLAQNRAEEAYEFIASHKNLVRRPEHQAHLLYNLGLAAFKLERCDEALALFNEYANTDPRDARCQFLIGFCALQQQNYEMARDAFHRYLTMNPGASDRIKVERWLTDIE